MLDVATTVRPDFWELKEVVLLLTAPTSLDPSLALGLYVRCASADGWNYRGCVHAGHPSEVMPLQWPHVESPQAAVTGPGVAQVGI